MGQILKAAAFASVVFGLCVAQAGVSHAAITDFTTWTQVQDPPHANFTASTTATQATLLASNGPIPSGTDIGYQSVNGSTPALSTAGHAFDPASSFSVAIDFNLAFANSPAGGLAIGFGVGEDGDGENSAGAVMFTQNGAPQLFFGGAARTNDVTASPQPIFVGAALTGSMFASYDAATGNITLGASTTPGAASPAGTTTFTGVQNGWDNTLLLTSFFLRSDNSLGQAWQSGNAQAVFSNFRVLSGSPTAIPEPATLATFAFATALLLRRRRNTH